MRPLGWRKRRRRRRKRLDEGRDTPRLLLSYIYGKSRHFSLTLWMLAVSHDRSNQYALSRGPMASDEARTTVAMSRITSHLGESQCIVCSPVNHPC